MLDCRSAGGVEAAAKMLREVGVVALANAIDPSTVAALVRLHLPDLVLVLVLAPSGPHPIRLLFHLRPSLMVNAMYLSPARPRPLDTRGCPRRPKPALPTRALGTDQPVTRVRTIAGNSIT